MRRFALGVVAASIALGGANASGISGTYFGRGDDAAFMVQLVESADHKITGRYAQVVLAKSGAIKQIDAAVSGTTDGRIIVLTITPTELLSASLTTSGTTDGSTLNVTGSLYGQTLTLNLHRADEAEFPRAVAALNVRALEVASAKAHASMMARIERLNSSITAFAGKVDETSKRLASSQYEKKYRDVTDWMRAAHARQRSILGDGQAFVARSQLGVAINQASIQADQLHLEMDSLLGEVVHERDELIRQNADTFNLCRQVRTGGGSEPDIKEACDKLAHSVDAAKSKAEILIKEAAAAETVWQEQHRAQQEVLRDSNLAVR